MKICLSCGHRFASRGWRCSDCGATPQQIGGYYAFAPALARHSDGFSADFFPSLFQLESGHFWFATRNRIILWGLQKYLPQTRTFFEVGCGTGFVISSLARALPSLQLSASEILVTGLNFAAGRAPRAEMFQMDARSIPFDSEFDAIGAFDVIEHIEEDDVVLREIWRALKPGGGVLLTVPQHPFLWSPLDDVSFHKRRYTSLELGARLRQAGFEVLHMTSFVSLLLPLMLLSRMQYKIQNHKSSFDELRISPAMSRLFSVVSRLEEWLIKRDISLPAGGSLFAIARRPPGGDGLPAGEYA